MNEKRKKPATLEELKRIRRPVRNINQVHKESLSGLDKLAVWITNHVGTMGFFMTIFTWTTFWLLWNSLGPKSMRFDPYPAFVLWLFISNMIQIFLMPLIMIGQNLGSHHAELRGKSDYEVNLKAEREIETILIHLENQNEILAKVLERLDINPETLAKDAVDKRK